MLSVVEKLPLKLWPKAVKENIKREMKWVNRPSMKEMREALHRFTYLRKLNEAFRKVNFDEIMRQVKKEGKLLIELGLGAQSSSRQLGLDPVGGELTVTKHEDGLVYTDPRHNPSWTLDGERTLASGPFIETIYKEPGVSKFFDRARSEGLDIAVKALLESPLRLEISRKTQGEYAAPARAAGDQAHDNGVVHQLSEYLPSGTSRTRLRIPKFG